MHGEADETPLVHVVDDDDSVRRVLDSLFRSVGLSTLTYRSAGEFIDTVKADSLGCVVLDVRLPGLSGIEAQTRLWELGILLPVVLMTGHGDIPMTVRAMKAGAVDFLPKPFRDQDMLDAVAAAIDRDRDRRASARERTRIANRFSTLSIRERQVMLLVTGGKMNKQAASELGISEITVKIHRGSAMRKMGAQTFADLVRMADLVRDQSTK